MLRNYQFGVGVVGADVELTNMVIRDTRAYGEFGQGIAVGSDSVVTGHHMVIEGNAGHGALANNGRLVLEDSIVRNTIPTNVPDRLDGIGVEFSTGATGALQRVLVQGNRIGG